MAWAKLLVRLKGEIRPSSINILEGGRSYEMQLWWEVQPWEAEVFPVKRELGLRKTDHEVEDESISCVS